MLALNLVKQRRRDPRIAVVEPVLGGGIERIDIARDKRGILGLAPAPGSAGGEQQRGGGGGQNGELERGACGHGLSL